MAAGEVTVDSNDKMTMMTETTKTTTAVAVKAKATTSRQWR